MFKTGLLAVFLAVSVPACVVAQQETPPVPDMPIQERPGKIPSKQIFAEYCASCHGISGKGDGPVAASLKAKPTDLTRLAAHNKGKFPELRVIQAIKAGPSVPAHGTAVMPVWGPIFVNEGTAANLSEMQLLIYNLMEYIKTLQVK
jgi:cytochrome c553